jgi:hypothetical protein
VQKENDETGSRQEGDHLESICAHVWCRMSSGPVNLQQCLVEVKVSWCGPGPSNWPKAADQQRTQQRETDTREEDKAREEMRQDERLVDSRLLPQARIVDVLLKCF